MADFDNIVFSVKIQWKSVKFLNGLGISNYLNEKKNNVKRIFGQVT